MSEVRKYPRNAPIERFIWRDGDVEIIHDPRNDPNRRRMKKKPRQQVGRDGEQVRLRPKPS